jgi:DNA-binding transcriptional ArsR family regulator
MSLRDVDPTTELRALAHPVRLRILSLITGAPLTAADVARELDITHANASYHLRHLLASGLVEIDGEERIRGGAAKRYRPVAEAVDRPIPPDRTPAPVDEERLVYAALATELRRRAGLARASTRKSLVDAELWVDPKVWAEVTDRITAAAVDLHHAARAPHAVGTTRVSMTIAMFQMKEES